MQEIREQLLYYLDAFWRRRWIAFATSVVIASIAWALVATLPNVYEARTKIFVDTASVLNPLLQGVAVDNDVEAQLAIMRETLLSRPNLEKVARQTDLDLEAHTDAEYDAMIEDLEDRISLSSSKTNIFTIAYEDRERARSHAVVRALMTLFVENNLGRNREDMASAQKFLDRQIQLYETKLDEAERELANFKGEHMDLLPGQQGLQMRLAEAERQLEGITAQLSDARARQAILRRELQVTPEMLTQQVGAFGFGPPSDAEADVVEVRALLEALRSRYTDKHPDVQAAKRQLDGLQRELESDQMQAGPPTGVPEDAADRPPNPQEIRTPNPTYSQVRLRLLEEESNVQALRRQVEAKANEMAELRQQLALVPEVEAELSKLNRDHVVIQTKYEALLTRRETAEISSDREQQSDSVQFRIVEPPLMPTVPAGPPRSTFLALALLLSFGVGGGVTALLATLKTTYGSINHLKRDYDLPVIGTVSIPKTPGRRLLATCDGVGLGAAVAVLVAVCGGLLLLERAVGLPAVVDGGMTPGEIVEVLSGSLESLRGGRG